MRPFKLGYVSCCQRDAWITVHTHVNIVAVALMADIPCIIIPEGIEVEEATIKKAKQVNYYDSVHRPSYSFCIISVLR